MYIHITLHSWSPLHTLNVLLHYHHHSGLMANCPVLRCLTVVCRPILVIAGCVHSSRHCMTIAVDDLWTLFSDRSAHAEEATPRKNDRIYYRKWLGTRRWSCLVVADTADTTVVSAVSAILRPFLLLAHKRPSPFFYTYPHKKTLFYNDK